MSNNIHGIFANTINGNVNTGVNAVRGWDDAKCRRVYRACVEILGAEATAWERETFSTAYNGGTSMLNQYASLHRITAGQAWAAMATDSVRASCATETVIAGSERNDKIVDYRTADTALRLVKAA